MSGARSAASLASERREVVVVGAGHAGLAISRCLAERGLDHVVLERGRLAERWRSERWDSLTLLTPNWATWLPDWRYEGDDPDGFMGRDEVVAYLQSYADSFGAPLRCGVEVHALRPRDGGYLLRTGDGEIEARSVVVATGPFQEPRAPALAGEIPAGVVQLHSSRYRNPGQLPPGAALVVGGGASGQQIAEDLLRAGRRTYLSVAGLKAAPRSYRGRDYFWWAENAGFYAKTVDSFPDRRPPRSVSPSLTGVGGGHDLDVRRLAAQGAVVVGRLAAADGARLRFAPDLAASLAAGDEATEQFVRRAEKWLDAEQLWLQEPARGPALPDPPAAARPIAELDLARDEIRSIVWATGFSYAFDWIDAPVLDSDGAPIHERGVTSSPGLFFLGLQWLWRLRSAFIRGAEEDARHLVRPIEERSRARS